MGISKNKFKLNFMLELNNKLYICSVKSANMNVLPLTERTQIVSLLVEGNSLRSISRITGKSINTVSKLLVDVGKACEAFHQETVKNVTAKRVQCDEIWSFVYAKQKNVPEEMKDEKGVGDCWTWVGMDADSKLVVSWLVGNRNAECANTFMQDVAARLESVYRI